jgi:hypothetical protein
MITIKRLNELTAGLPDTAACYAYEGEVTGIIIVEDPSKNESRRWVIETGGLQLVEASLVPR